MGHTTRHLQHPRHHRNVRPTNVTPQRPETTPSPLTPPATPHMPHTSPSPCSPTITLAISVHDIRGTNTTGDDDSDNS